MSDNEPQNPCAPATPRMVPIVGVIVDGGRVLLNRPLPPPRPATLEELAGG